MMQPKSQKAEIPAPSAAPVLSVLPWTRFMDMHSGGGAKEDWEIILIEAPADEAEIIFYNRFGHSPSRVSCTCCGDDYSISESETLAQATAYDRNCAYEGDGYYVEKPRSSKYTTYELIPLDQYITQKNVLLIRASDIKPEERIGDVPRQGFVWCD